jgi:hypothetical protein
MLRRIAWGRLLVVIFSVATLSSAAFARSPEIYTGIVSATAVGGYDPVAYFTEGKPVQGSKEIAFTWKV